MYRLVTLGGCSVVSETGEVRGAAAQPRRLAMLAVLARAGDRGVSRARLLELFWPDEADEDRRRKALAQALYALRRDLGDEAVISGTQDLRLDPALLPSDLHAFTAGLRAGRHADAAAMYAGPFLSGFHLAGASEFERWAEEERGVIERDYLRALEALASRAERDGDTASAVVWWRKAAAIDPLDSRTTLALMRALAANGEVAAAVRQATIHETIVEQELELPADRKVLAFAAELRARPPAPSDAAPKRTPTGATPSAAPTPAPTHTPPSAAPTPAPTHTPPSAAPTHAPPSVAATAPSAPVVALATSADTPPSPSPGTREPAIGDTSAAFVPVSRSAARAPTARRLPRARGLAVGAVVTVLAVLGWGTAKRSIAADESADVDARRAPSVAVGLIADYRTTAQGPVRSLAALLATSMARSDAMRVVSAARLGELLQQGGHGDTSESAYIAAARLAGARELVDGSLFAPADGELRLDLRRVDVASGNVLAAITIRGPDLFALADSGTARLLDGFGAAPILGSVRDVTTRSEIAHRFYAEGLRARASYDVEAARRLFGEALREDSLFAMAAFEYARVNPNRAELAEEMERAVRLAQRASPRERLVITAGFASVMQSPGLLEAADSLLRLDENDPHALVFAGEARLNLGRAREAVSYLERAIALDSLALGTARPEQCHACSAIQQLIRAGFDEDAPDAAVRAAERWVRAAPQSADAWGALSRTHDFAGRFEESAQARDRAVALNPAYPAAFVRRISNLVRQARFPEAESLARAHTTLPTADQRLDGWWQLAGILRHQGRMNEALIAVRRFRALRDSVDGGQMALNNAYLPALILHDAGRTREAIALFDSMAQGLVRSGEHTANVKRLRTIALTAAADFEAMSGDTSRLAQRVRDVESAGAQSGIVRDTRAHHYVRGLQLRARGRLDDAINEWRAALAPPVRGYHSRINLELARALLERGQPDDAARVIRPIMRDVLDGVAVTHTEMHELLARAHAAAGRRDSARVHAAWVVQAWERAEPTWRTRAEQMRALLAN
jgi:DNA-binding SARP family transcriptional activator/tetratricopeptide (TPR) repeat protein